MYPKFSAKIVKKPSLHVCAGLIFQTTRNLTAGNGRQPGHPSCVVCVFSLFRQRWTVFPGVFLCGPCCRYFHPLVPTVGTMGNRPLHGFHPCKGTSHCSHYKTFFKKNLQNHSISLPLPRVGNRRTVCHRPLSTGKPPPRTCQNVCHMSKHAQHVCKSSLSGDKHALHMCKHFLSPRQTFLSRV